ncbi:4-hydroxybenzoate octaprenyltransferase [Acinetobacter rathckeae]|uniref:4-hydroxybenzoate octaprenyltransferase n=1 Tax=Acinetobacter rathckeae TaxID=2605272 RepID=UPI0018A2FCBE|nr:4-hydroxybenzoate octaprenyltransferase [Acinetobacter rathckeae]MBF7686929.1 4-hydroxybenzoate octaprenyltransferase [Acinetobacter rathckeae]
MTISQQHWKQKLSAYYRLCRFDKPIGTELVLWPTLWALWIASGGMPDLKTLVVMVLGAIFMRAAGCVINDFADRKVDLHVERTKHRPLTAGEISSKEALALFFILIIASASLLFFLPMATFYCAFGALFLACIYPFMKRYTHLPQVVLGAAFSWAIPMAFTAVGRPIDFTCVLLYMGNLAWTVAYDTQYAITDREDDLKIGVKSTAILFGRLDILMIVALQCLSVLLVAWAMYRDDILHPYGTIALSVVLVDFFYQWLNIRQRNPKQCFQMFLHNRWVGMIIFIGIFFSLL